MIARLTERANVTRQAITRHLHALEDAGVVQSERAGREQIWTLRPERSAEARAYLARVSERWGEAMQRLRRLVET